MNAAAVERVNTSGLQQQHWCKLALLYKDQASCLYEELVLKEHKCEVGRSTLISKPPGCAQLSRCQAIFCFDEENCGWTITDTSMNGTYVNNDRLEKGTPVKLNDGDKISFSEDKLSYRFYTQLNVRPHKKQKLETDCFVNEPGSSTQPLPAMSQQHMSFDEEKHVLSEKLGNSCALQEKLQLERKHLYQSKEKDEIQMNEVLRKKEDIEAKIAKAEEAAIKNDTPQDAARLKRLHEEQQRLERLLKEKLDTIQEQRNKLQQMEQELEQRAKEEAELLKEKIELEQRFIESQEAQKELQAAQRREFENALAQTQKEYLEKEEEILQMLSAKEEEFQREQAKYDREKMLTENKFHRKTAALKAEHSRQLEQEKKTMTDITSIVESELQCSICCELYIVAVTLNCTHMFCQSCIRDWESKKRNRNTRSVECPICRTPVESIVRSRTVDSFIDQIVQKLPEEIKLRRLELVTQRKRKEQTRVGEPTAFIDLTI